MLALMLGSKFCSGKKSSCVPMIEVSVVRFFEDSTNAVGFGGVQSFGVTGIGGSPLFSLVNLARNSLMSHLWPGRSVGIHAAAMPKKTSQERQYQLGILAQVGSPVSFCQFRIVRTIEREPVTTPRPMSRQRPILLRRSI